MRKLFVSIWQFFSEIRRRQVFRVAVVYGTISFVVLQAADILQPALQLPSWTVRLITVLLILGFPLAIGLAWVYNLSEGEIVEVEEESDHAAGGSGITWSLVIAGLLVVAVGLFLYPRFWPLDDEAGRSSSPAGTDAAQVSQRSVAVLPFENQGGEDNEQFTEGFHDGLLTRLSRISDLTVKSRTSVARYADTGKTIPQIANELGANWIVEGAVQRVGEQVKVTAQLIQAPDDVHEWAKSYQREVTADNFFAIQSELTQEVARSLEARLSPQESERIERTPTRNLDAYELYVAGRQELARRALGDPEKAIDLFRRAIKMDSGFALAWSGLADSAGATGWGTRYFDSLDVTPEEAARRALELAPDLAEARASMGLVHYRQRNGPAALRELKQAVALKPSYSEAHHWLGLTYLVLGRAEDSLRHLELAKELNPQHLFARHYLYDAYIVTGRPRLALDVIREQQRRYPEYHGLYIAETRAYYALGEYDQARQAMEELVSIFGDEARRNWIYQAYVAATETATGNTVAARQRLATMREIDAPPIGMAYWHAALGDAEKTLSALDEIEEWSYVPITTLRYTTFPEGMSRIRTDPLYASLVRELNRAWGLEPDGSLPGQGTF